MNFRRAQRQDIPQIMNLLSQVLEVHAAIRPDIFVSGKTKYSVTDVENILEDEQTPVYVATDETDCVLGYAFCRLKPASTSEYMIPFTTLFIDDLCVDESRRGQHVGSNLFAYVRSEATRLGCYDITLNVWEGNDDAIAFYKAMGLRTRESQLEFILPEEG